MNITNNIQLIITKFFKYRRNNLFFLFKIEIFISLSRQYFFIFTKWYIFKCVFKVHLFKCVFSKYAHLSAFPKKYAYLIVFQKHAYLRQTISADTLETPPRPKGPRPDTTKGEP